MITLKIIVFASIVLDLILIVAYIELHAQKQWLEKQFYSKPRAFRRIEKISWQRRVVNTLLLRKPVSIKQPFNFSKTDGNKKFVRMEN